MSRRTAYLLFAALSLAILMAGCGGSGGVGSLNSSAVAPQALAGPGAADLQALADPSVSELQSIPPTVYSTFPVKAATGVPINRKIIATFSQRMAPSTITTGTFILKRGTTPVSGAVTYAYGTAIFAPASKLAPNTKFTATLTRGVKDTAGRVMASAYVWTFTTGATSDTTAPVVLPTGPANGATNVATRRVLTAFFNESIDPARITTATFTLKQGTTPVAGYVGCFAARTATFTPKTTLTPSTTYTATITTGVKDLAGNALARAHVWRFTTGQAPVNLRSAAPFAVLAYSTVTNTALKTTINGDLGLSPGTAVTGFPPGIVNGTMHKTDPIAAKAKLDLTTAYNDAKGRTVSPAAVAGNLGGKTLYPGLYKSTSSLAVSSGNLTLNARGDANAVFIFQMASTFTMTSGRQIILSGGANPANIFWQVGSSATLGTTSVFKGSILANVSITMKTGATAVGRLLARTGAVTLDGNTVTRP